MKDRLKVSKELLKTDGVIAIAIDDEEQAYLKVICDEIFGKLNFIGTVVVQNKPSGRTTDAYFATCHEYLLFYSKTINAPKINFLDLTEEQAKAYKEQDDNSAYKWRDFMRTGGTSTPEVRRNSYYPIFFNPIKNHITLEEGFQDHIKILPIDSEGKHRVWRKTPVSFIEHLNNNEILIIQTKGNQWKVKIMDRIKRGIRPKSIWADKKHDASSHGTKLLKGIFEGEKVFSYPKSIYSVKDAISLFTETDNGDLILDFFAGSGTTAHAVLDLNKEDDGDRKFIICEQMDYVEGVTAERVYRILKSNNEDSFIYMELAKANQHFVEQIQSARTEVELLEIWAAMQAEAFISYKVTPDMIDKNTKDYEALSMEDKKRFLIETLDKNLLYVPHCDMESKEFGMSEMDKKATTAFYNLKNQA